MLGSTRRLSLIPLVLALASCRAPTAVELQLSTDVRCDDVRATSITVSRSSTSQLEPATVTSLCGADGSIGNLVITPNSDTEEDLRVLVVTAVGSATLDQCTGDLTGKPCIASRRRLRFVPNETLTLPIRQLLDCSGVACGETQTCRKGTCEDAEVDPDACLSSPEQCGGGDVPPVVARPFVPPNIGGAGGQGGAGGEAGQGGAGAGQGGAGGAGAGGAGAGGAGAGGAGMSGASGQAGAGGEAGATQGKVLKVGADAPYADPCAAIAAASAGDVIEIGPGVYTTSCSVKISLTVRGIGEDKPVLNPAQPISNQKGIFAVEGPEVDFTAENLEFMAAQVPDMNGAGIRFQGRDLAVKNCYFHDNQRGILTEPQRNVTIEGSEFVGNGTGDGLSPSVSIGNAERLIFRHNWVHASNKGVLLKSFARVSLLSANRLTDEIDTESNSLDFDVGGEVYLIGNLIEQTVTTSKTMVRFAPGNNFGPQSRLVMAHNTLVNRNDTGIFVSVGSGLEAQATLVNNLFFGVGDLPASSPSSSANLETGLSEAAKIVIDLGAYDFRLQPGASAAIDTGVDATPFLPASIPGFTLTQYVHPTSFEPRVLKGVAPDRGAYEAP